MLFVLDIFIFYYYDCNIYCTSTFYLFHIPHLSYAYPFAYPILPHLLLSPSISLYPIGCGIVEFSTPQEAQQAMADLNDTEFMGRQVFIREDREEGVGGGGGGGGAGVAGGGGVGLAMVMAPR